MKILIIGATYNYIPAQDLSSYREAQRMSKERACSIGVDIILGTVYWVVGPGQKSPRVPSLSPLQRPLYWVIRPNKN